ncbi:hypothetical protein ASPZODRAFT_12446 [Penicilliopsis zonata CBS 506.65]|uniref:O-methyltransferase C-terminal domain-containing protein n=1 Tax=Penicilliopsis zonata CBS 506.65 TaxID=1073090 RepID=A0A1L9SWP8_9EURO|nr:hypothetical protein ASPZODRAFT_12446 [Penicilliopsis zonata CBS 506.65]OJJ51632.1 hypothetical protein ASPZODRAFT_12446 [Penicilliopsis zonata CBS 506.65]
MASVSELASTLTSVLQKLPSLQEIPNDDRVLLLQVVNELQARLETYVESIQKLIFSPQDLSAIRLAQGMGIFDAFAASGDKELTLDELHSKVKGEKGLLVRIMRSLCCKNVCKETGQDRYCPLQLAFLFVNGMPTGELIKHFYANMRASARLYDYFEANGYQNPTDSYDAPFQLAFDTKDHYFEWLAKNPADQKAFNSTMTLGRRVRGKEWFEVFPVGEKLQASSDRALLVDIGGGIGHDLIEFKQQFPELPGRLVLQDLPQVIDDISQPLPDGIEAIKYDMFTPQPIRGAKAYYMRTVLHDWPAKQAVKALTQVREAMAEDSILILNENCIPESNVSWHSTVVDITMMEIFSSLERTQRQWVDLLEQAGFQVVGSYCPGSVRGNVFLAVDPGKLGRRKGTSSPSHAETPKKKTGRVRDAGGGQRMIIYTPDTGIIVGKQLLGKFLTFMTEGRGMTTWPIRLLDMIDLHSSWRSSTWAASLIFNGQVSGHRPCLVEYRKYYGDGLQHQRLFMQRIGNSTATPTLDDVVNTMVLAYTEGMLVTTPNAAQCHLTMAVDLLGRIGPQSCQGGLAWTLFCDLRTVHVSSSPSKNPK